MDYRQIKPRKTKYANTQKTQKGRVSTKIVTSGASKMKEGVIGLRADQIGRLTAKEIGSVLTYLRRKCKKICKTTLRTFPDIAVTRKPAESRLGGGKGAVDGWVSRVRKNAIILELNTIPASQIFESNAVTQKMEIALQKVSTKIRVKTTIVYKLNEKQNTNEFKAEESTFCTMYK